MMDLAPNPAQTRKNQTLGKNTGQLPDLALRGRSSRVGVRMGVGVEEYGSVVRRVEM